MIFDQQYCSECGDQLDILDSLDMDEVCYDCLTAFLHTAEGDRDYKCEPVDTEEDWKLIDLK